MMYVGFINMNIAALEFIGMLHTSDHSENMNKVYE